VKKHYSQAAEQNDWQEFKPLFGGGKIKICDTIRAVTPFGGLSVFIEFLGRIGLVEQLTERLPYQPQSPNHYQTWADSHWLYAQRDCWGPPLCPYRSITG
jgi:hypothetical protein